MDCNLLMEILVKVPRSAPTLHTLDMLMGMSFIEGRVVDHSFLFQLEMGTATFHLYSGE